MNFFFIQPTIYLFKTYDVHYTISTCAVNTFKEHLRTKKIKRCFILMTTNIIITYSYYLNNFLAKYKKK